MAIVFDLDGTLVDSETPIYLAWRTVYREEGLDLPAAEWAAAVGRPYGAVDFVQDLAKRLGRPLKGPEVRQRVARHFRRFFAEEALRPGVAKLLMECRREGIRLAVATSARRSWACRLLQRLDLLHDFPVVVTADDVRHPKPDPEPYRLALERLGVAPEAAVAVEDSPIGALSALRAGLFCVVVPNAVTAGQTFPAGVRRLQTLEGCSLARLAAWRSERQGADRRSSGG